MISGLDRNVKDFRSFVILRSLLLAVYGTNHWTRLQGSSSPRRIPSFCLSLGWHRPRK